MVSPSGADRGLRTARALLAPERVGVTLEDAPPDPPLGELGALAGFGAVVAGHDIHLSVYVLDAWGRGHDHAEALEARAGTNGRTALVAVNGQLLLVATAPAVTGAEARFLLNDLVSAFAGRE